MSRLRSFGSRFARSGIVLAYHDIIANDETPYLYAVRAATFIRQLDAVAALGYRFDSFANVAADIIAGRSVGGRAVVQFDDALVGVIRHAAPILAERGIPWTLLPVTERTGVSPDWWPEARGVTRTMTRPEIDEAFAAGAELAGHTATHVSLPGLSDERLHAELHTSRQVLSDWSGREVLDLCYPFGHTDPRVRVHAARAGFRTGWTFTNGRCAPGDDLYTLRRLAMHENVVSSLLWRSLLRPAWSWPTPVDHDPGFARPDGHGGYTSDPEEKQS